MHVVWSILRLIVLIFFVLLIGRLVLDWVQVFAREWRPRGIVLVVAETIYTVTDPPLKALRKLVPPLRIGRVAVDLGFMILFIVTLLLLQLLP